MTSAEGLFAPMGSRCSGIPSEFVIFDVDFEADKAQMFA
ncbi:hypothetical protein ymoll0001_11100 [Yersinia mollaretii ATCC 43969]|uniref:Uncharacterized protein n=1 Tax=Yersinia mollaretii (strain ATCC 43969 / DSM 18520 / CIP 103324 / CNY 7263 / WAIP 204) TaxID=349967 RepID=A0ABP2EPE4_YERMW|nr:hypothetical protein ymoll0001_11100 [Yersinia mollaretii ATCC 43969]